MALLLLIILPIVSMAQTPTETYTLQELRAKFTHENYTEKVLQELQSTLSSFSTKPELKENVIGEVISCYALNGKFSWHNTYLIINNELKEVQTIPQDDAFLNKLNSFVPPDSRFAYGFDLWSFAFVNKKLENNHYLIKATATSFNSQPDFPNDDILTYDLEYQTKDFEHFQLLRLKDIHSEKWIEVEDY